MEQPKKRFIWVKILLPLIILIILGVSAFYYSSRHRFWKAELLTAVMPSDKIDICPCGWVNDYKTSYEELGKCVKGRLGVTTTPDKFETAKQSVSLINGVTIKTYDKDVNTQSMSYVYIAFPKTSTTINIDAIASTELSNSNISVSSYGGLVKFINYKPIDRSFLDQLSQKYGFRYEDKSTANFLINVPFGQENKYYKQIKDKGIVDQVYPIFTVDPYPVMHYASKTNSDVCYKNAQQYP